MESQHVSLANRPKALLHCMSQLCLFYVLILCQTKVYFSADSEEFIHPMPTLLNFEAYQKKGRLSLGIINKV